MILLVCGAVVAICTQLFCQSQGMFNHHLLFRRQLAHRACINKTPPSSPIHLFRFALRHYCTLLALLSLDENPIFLIGTSLLPAMKIREYWILGIVVKHPNLATVSTAQSRLCPSHFVEVVFHDWNSYFAEFVKVDFS